MFFNWELSDSFRLGGQLTLPAPDVRFGSIADIATGSRDVRFTPNSGHSTTYFAVDVRRAEVILRPSGFSGFFVLGGGHNFLEFQGPQGDP
jgi:hypothetical protein